MVRRPERRQLPAEVQFEVTLNSVTHTADPGTARPLTGPRQGREEHVAARLELGSCRRPEPIELRWRSLGIALPQTGGAQITTLRGWAVVDRSDQELASAR